jgi:hypothetical protein
MLTAKREQAMREDFRNFLAYIWDWLGLPEPTPRQYEMAYYLQHGPKRKIIEGFRGIGKSWVTSAYVLWRLWCDPDYKFLVVSASKMRADDFSTFTLRLIKEVDILSHLRPGKEDRESKVSFDVGPSKAAHAPSVKSLGVFSQLAGSRAVEIIADDVEVPNNSNTQDLREKLIKACTEFEAIIMPETGKITYLGTPQTEESIYNKLRERGYEARIWPARFPDLSDKDIYGGALAPNIVAEMERDPSVVGDPTDPKRFNDLDLTEREVSYGRSGFTLQFMLDTSLSDAEKYPLKTADIIVTSVNVERGPVTIQYGSGPEQYLKDVRNVGFTGDKWFAPMYFDKDNWTEYEGRAMSIDPSGRGTDETTFAIGLQLHGNIFVPEVDGLSGGYTEDVLEYLAKKAKQYKVNNIIIESNFGDGMFLALFQPILNRYHPVNCEEVRHNIQKEARIIDSLEPVMNQHRLIFDRSVIEKDLKVLDEKMNYSLFYQMTRLTKERGALKHDDRLDAMAILVTYFMESMKRDASRAENEWQNRMLDKELKDFHKGLILGRPKQESNGFLLHRR